LAVQNKHYDKLYYRGRGSNYIFGYRNLRSRLFWRRRLKVLAKISPSGRLLDIGCAFGFFIKILEKKYQVYGIDISEYAIKQARNLVSHPEYLKCCDVTQGIPFRDKFNVITAFDIIEHIAEPLTVFKIIRPSLAEAGSLYLELPLSKTLIDFDRGHHYRPLEEWLNLLSSAGFKPNFMQTYYTVGLRGVMIPAKRRMNYASIVVKAIP